MSVCKRWLRIVIVLAVASALGGCEPPAVYGSVGVSSYQGYGGYGGRYSISMGGRIF